MRGEHSIVEKVRYYSSVSTIYLLTLLFAWYAVHPPTRHNLGKNIILASSIQNSSLPLPAQVTRIYGQPIRIVIPGSGIDLPVDPGYYDSAQSTWTLSGYRAQFAMISAPANNKTGNTFIYGHNNNYVFGALRHATPAVGAEALLYTDTGHVFDYNFQYSYNLAPDDTSVFNYRGSPIMTIQTCTGSVNEIRTMYRFSFSKVVQ